jgi:hypothetical protein
LMLSCGIKWPQGRDGLFGALKAKAAVRVKTAPHRFNSCGPFMPHDILLKSTIIQGMITKGLQI